MTDINKQIEEESREYLKSKKIACFPVPREYLREGFIDGYNACLHSSRWRKVSEGLPPIDDAGVSINVLINVRLKSKNQDLTCAIEGFYDFDIEEWFLLIPLPEKYKIEILSWKPID